MRRPRDVLSESCGTQRIASTVVDYRLAEDRSAGGSPTSYISPCAAWSTPGVVVAPRRPLIPYLSRMTSKTEG